jgi:hypothetical protein
MAEQIINSQQSFDAYLEHLKAQWEEHRYLRVDMKTGKQRTPTQNRCLHLYCTQLSTALNDAGFDMKKTLKPSVEIPWRMEMAKEHLWGPIQKVVTGHSSTTKPERKQYSEIYDVLNRHISGKFGIYVPWPSIDTLADRVRP